MNKSIKLKVWHLFIIPVMFICMLFMQGSSSTVDKVSTSTEYNASKLYTLAFDDLEKGNSKLDKFMSKHPGGKTVITSVEGYRYVIIQYSYRK